MDEIFNQTNSSYYIHLHAKNIGVALYGKQEKYQDLAKTLFDSNINSVINAAFEQYKNYAISNVLDNNTALILSEIFDDKYKDIDQQMLNILQDSYDEAIKDIQRKILNNFKNADYENIINNFFDQKGQINIKQYNNFIQLLSDTIKMIEGQEGLAEAILLAQSNNKKYITSQIAGHKIQQALNSYAQSHNGDIINIKRSNHLIKQLNSIASSFIDYTKKETKSPNYLKNLLEKNFLSTGLGETLGSMLASNANMTINKAIIELAGDKQYFQDFTDLYGNHIKSSSDLKNIKRSGKTDVNYGNVDFQIEIADDGIMFNQLAINLGVSVKTYLSQNFYNSTNQEKINNFSFSSGSMGSLKEALLTIFNGNPQGMYYAMNILSHGDLGRHDTAQYTLQDLLIKRNIVRLIASRGGASDFNQFIIFNGKVISTYQIMLAAFQQQNGSSVSQMNKKQLKGTQGFTLRIDGKNNLITTAETPVDSDLGNNIAAAWRRSHSVNSLFNSASVSIEVHVNNLLKIIDKK